MKDHRIVRVAVFLCFVAISLVYALFFEQKGDTIRHDVVSIMTHFGLLDEMTGAVQTGDLAVIDTGVVVTGEQTEDTISTQDKGSFLAEVMGGSGKVLSGTDLYYGSLDSLKILGIRYQYILKDSTYDIFYAYIGKNVAYTIPDLVGSLGGKTVEIYAKNDIINNLYFGDRVTFVTLPQQSDKTTIFFVRMGSDLWMITDMTGEYKKHKRYIRSLFTGTGAMIQS